MRRNDINDGCKQNSQKVERSIQIDESFTLPHSAYTTKNVYENNIIILKNDGINELVMNLSLDMKIKAKNLQKQCHGNLQY